MVNKKRIIILLHVILLSNLSAQTPPNEDTTFYKNRILEAPGPIFKKFTDAGMAPTNHLLTEAEQEKVDKAFLLLPPLHKKILKEHLHSISFMDNMPNTALTSPIESEDTIKKFNITFRAGTLNETISDWATWKEKSLYDFSANPSFEIQIDAGNFDAFVYILLHEATHIVDAVLQLTPHVEDVDSVMIPTPYTKNIWRLFNIPEDKFINPLLAKTRFRSGKIQPISSAPALYFALKKTPFASLYGMASCYEDIAELITIYHLTNKLNQPFVIYVKENGKIKSKFEPMKNKLVKRRLQQLTVFYS